MSFFNNSLAEDQYVGYTDMPAYSQGWKTGYMYPNPASLGTQTYMNHHSMNVQHAYMTYYVMSAQQASMDHSSMGPQSYDQYDQFIQPAADMGLVQNAEDLVPNLIQPIEPTLQLSNQPMVYYSPSGIMPLGTGLGQGPPTAMNYADYSTTLDSIYTNPNCRKSKTLSDGPKNVARHHGGSKKSGHQSQARDDKPQRLVRRNATSPAYTRRSSPSKSPSPATMATVGAGMTMSKLGQKKALLGDKAGTDNRKRAEVLWDNEILFGLVDKEWKPAGYHRNFRERLILKAAQQAGAPAWRKALGLNYTSYSPTTQGWTNDPGSVRDEKGRQIMLFEERPADWEHNPKCDRYLMHDGLVMLDQNNRPIKDYPGIPLTLDNKSPGWYLFALRRYSGMTVSDFKARMILEYTGSNGVERVLQTSAFTNRMGNYFRRMQLTHWHKRRPRKETAAPVSPLDDERDIAEIVP